MFLAYISEGMDYLKFYVDCGVPGKNWVYEMADATYKRRQKCHLKQSRCAINYN